MNEPGQTYCDICDRDFPSFKLENDVCEECYRAHYADLHATGDASDQPGAFAAKLNADLIARRVERRRNFNALLRYERLADQRREALNR